MKNLIKTRDEIPRRYRRLVTKALRELRGTCASQEFYSAISALLGVPEKTHPVVRAQAYFLLLKYRDKINLKRVKI